jgi:hypothetical protein
MGSPSATSKVGLGRVKTLLSSPPRAAYAPIVSRHRNDAELAPEQAWIAFINGLMPTMFLT